MTQQTQQSGAAQTQQATPGNQQVVKFENISAQVLARIQSYQEDGTLVLPENYAVANHLKSAWLILQETKDKSEKPALIVCSKESIANALLDMVLQGLAVSKKQGYFIVFGTKLLFMRSYFGSVALAKRVKPSIGEPIANVIYEGDDFVYTIDPKTGLTTIVKHEQKIENINLTKIKGAYCIVSDGEKTQVTIMTMEQIRNSWNQGAAKGNSGAHKNFTDEMAKKTVISRACKLIINSSDDGWLFEDKRDESDTDIPGEQRDEAVKSSATGKLAPKPEDVDYVDLSSVNSAGPIPEEPQVSDPQPQSPNYGE